LEHGQGASESTRGSHGTVCGMPPSLLVVLTSSTSTSYIWDAITEPLRGPICAVYRTMLLPMGVSALSDKTICVRNVHSREVHSMVTLAPCSAGFSLQVIGVSHLCLGPNNLQSNFDSVLPFTNDDFDPTNCD
jgi:hypothetical protein